MTRILCPRPRVLLASQHNNRAFQKQIAAGVKMGGGELVAIVEKTPKQLRSSRLLVSGGRLRRMLIDRYSPRMAARIVYLDQDDPDGLARIVRKFRIDLVILARWDLLPANVLELPPLGTINTHISLLPQLRGSSPIKGALLAGLKQTGVTVHFIDAGIDTGDIIAQRSFPILCSDTEHSIEMRAANLLRGTYAEVMEFFQSGNVPRQRQETSKGSYFSWRSCFDFDGTSSLGIDWSAPAWLIERVATMHQCHILCGREHLAIEKTEGIFCKTNGMVGSILDVGRNHLVVQAGTGAIKLAVGFRDSDGWENRFERFNVGDCLSSKAWPGWRKVVAWATHQ